MASYPPFFLNAREILSTEDRVDDEIGSSESLNLRTISSGGGSSAPAVAGAAGVVSMAVDICAVEMRGTRDLVDDMNSGVGAV